MYFGALVVVLEVLSTETTGVVVGGDSITVVVVVVSGPQVDDDGDCGTYGEVWVDSDVEVCDGVPPSVQVHAGGGDGGACGQYIPGMQSAAAFAGVACCTSNTGSTVAKNGKIEEVNFILILVNVRNFW